MNPGAGPRDREPRNEAVTLTTQTGRGWGATETWEPPPPSPGVLKAGWTWTWPQELAQEECLELVHRGRVERVRHQETLVRERGAGATLGRMAAPPPFLGVTPASQSREGQQKVAPGASLGLPREGGPSLLSRSPGSCNT